MYVSACISVSSCMCPLYFWQSLIVCIIVLANGSSEISDIKHVGRFQLSPAGSLAFSTALLISVTHIQLFTEKLDVEFSD